MRKSLRTRLTVYFIALVLVPLLVVGLIGTWQTYNTQVFQALYTQSHEAKRVAEQVKNFIQWHENELRALIDVRGLSAGTLEEQTALLSSLFSKQSGYEELILTDSRGLELIYLSRSSIVTANNLGNRSYLSEFEKPKETVKTYFGPVSINGDTGEPFMIVSIPLFDLQTGQLSYVLIATVRFKAVWDIMAQADVMGSGIVYMTDNNNYVIAHASPSIVLKRTQITPPLENSFTTGLNGNVVAMAREQIAFNEQIFYIISEQPAAEALSLALNNIILTVVATLIAVAVAGFLGVLAARQITHPISELARTAHLISEGDLTQVSKVTAQDEIGTLADAFNRMTTQLRGLIGGLEQRVAERTAELTQRGTELEKINQELEIATRQAERRAAQLAASAQVARAISRVRTLEQLLSEVAQLISQSFGYYHVGIFTVDELGRFAVLRATNSEGGRRMLARGHKLIVGEQGIVGNVTGAGLPRIALDVGADAVHFDNPDLPETRSEMALPLRLGTQTFGALDVQSLQAAAFTEEDVAVLAALADQIVIAIENARLFAQSQAALQEAEETAQRYLRQAWKRLTSTLQTTGYEYHISGVPVVGSRSLPEIEQVLRRGEMVIAAGDGDLPARTALAVPIKLRNQVIGVIDLHETDLDRHWTDDNIAVLLAVADQTGLSLENARLLEETERSAQRERTINEINSRVRQTVTIDSILKTAVNELGKSLTATHIFARISRPDTAENDRDRTG